MKNINRYFTEFSFFIFYLIITFLYAFIVQFNPILPINIAIWALYCFIIFQLSKQIKRSSIWNERAIIYLYLLFGIYSVYLVKSTYYVAYLNEIYLSGGTSLVPKNFENDLARTIINPEIFIQKLEFFLSWDNISFSLGRESTFNFGIFWSNIFRAFEVLGILISPLIFAKLVLRKKKS
jgi:hypothetical protein